jgi:hypothetical protein
MITSKRESIELALTFNKLQRNVRRLLIAMATLPGIQKIAQGFHELPSVDISHSEPEFFIISQDGLIDSHFIVVEWSKVDLLISRLQAIKQEGGQR